jgi:ABC-type nitrate/sulfonate/bicarbonate transport system ATPase subunit
MVVLSLAQVPAPEVNAEPHITVRGLRAKYGDVEVLHGIDFEVSERQFVSIVGKSGCGKSTLLHALAGFIEKDGDVRMPADIGVVFQNYAIFPWLTVKGNIGFGIPSVDSASKKEILASHLEMVGLSAEGHKYPFQLSGGQAQRVALARVLAANPSVILMDEPFGALDMFTRERMQTWLLKIWNASHKTVLFVTHNIEEALFLSDRVLVLGGGNVLVDLNVPFERPRLEALKFTPAFVELKKQILDKMDSN